MVESERIGGKNCYSNSGSMSLDIFIVVSELIYGRQEVPCVLIFLSIKSHIVFLQGCQCDLLG